MATPSWDASTEHLSAHADQLLTDAAEESLTDLVGGEPDLLPYLALLQLARTLGVEPAHALVTDPAALPAALAAATGPEERLPLVRLPAGLDPGNAERRHQHRALATRTLQQP